MIRRHPSPVALIAAHPPWIQRGPGHLIAGWALCALLAPALVGTAHAEPVHAWLDPVLLRADIATYGRDSDRPWARIVLNHQGRDYHPLLAARWAFTGNTPASDSTSRPRGQLRWEEAVLCRYKHQGHADRYHLGIMFTPSSKYWKDNGPYRYACISMSPNASAPTAVSVHPSAQANRVEILYTTMRWHDGTWLPRADHRIRHANTLPSRQWLTEGPNRFAMTYTSATGTMRRPCLVERQVGKDGNTPLFEFAPGYADVVNGSLRCTYRKLIEDKPGWQKSLKWETAVFKTPLSRFRMFRNRNL